MLTSSFFLSPLFFFFLFPFFPTKFESYNKSIIAFLLGRTVQGNVQFSGYVLSLPAVGPILPLELNIPLYCPPSHAIILHEGGIIMIV